MTLKKELVYRHSWPTRRELETAVFDYIEALGAGLGERSKGAGRIRYRTTLNALIATAPHPVVEPRPPNSTVADTSTGRSARRHGSDGAVRDRLSSCLGSESGATRLP